MNMLLFNSFGGKNLALKVSLLNHKLKLVTLKADPFTMHINICK